MADDLRHRIAKRIGEAWPDLAEDPVYLDQVAAQAMAVVGPEVERLRYERRLLGAARMTLDLIAAGDPDRQEQARREAEDLAQRIVDEIGHPVTDEPALGPSYRAELERLRKELAETRTEKVAALLGRIGDWDEIGEYVRKIEAERDELKAATRAALEIYAVHWKTEHIRPNPDCDTCQMGLCILTGCPTDTTVCPHGKPISADQPAITTTGVTLCACCGDSFNGRVSGSDRCKTCRADKVETAICKCGHPDDDHDAGECWAHVNGDQCPCSWYARKAIVTETRETAPMRPEDVDGELVDDAVDVWHETPNLLLDDRMRAILAAVQPAARRMWFREQYGDPIARRSEPLRTDDPAEIFMRIRPDCVVVSRADLEAYLNRGKDLRAETAALERLRVALGDQP